MKKMQPDILSIGKRSERKSKKFEKSERKVETSDEKT
jgi:hypothetical protein